MSYNLSYALKLGDKIIYKYMTIIYMCVYIYIHVNICQFLQILIQVLQDGMIFITIV